MDGTAAGGGRDRYTGLTAGAGTTLQIQKKARRNEMRAGGDSDWGSGDNLNVEMDGVYSRDISGSCDKRRNKLWPG